MIDNLNRQSFKAKGSNLNFKYFISDVASESSAGAPAW